MKLKIKKFDFLTGRPVCMINRQTAREMSFHVGQRVLIKRDGGKLISIVDIIEDVLKKNEIAVSEEVLESLQVKHGDIVDVELAEKPHCIDLIKEKLKGRRLNEKEMYEIIENIADNALTEVEIAFFVSAIYEEGLSFNETKYLTKAMIKTGNQLKFKGHVADKHSVGGVAGNITTPIIVSICASEGLIIPKTSSRAITSAAGTADVIETIARVDFSSHEIKHIVNKTNGCFVWGGSLGLAPVDDKIIKIEKIVNIDSSSQVIASILSKKISVGSKWILIDIPCGKSAKFTRLEAKKLKERFLQMGKLFKLTIKVVLTDGSEPIGNGIGPALEMKEVIQVLTRNNPPQDLEEKSLLLAGELFELVGKAKKGKGILLAKKILESGQALKKFIEIINAQQGNIHRLDKLIPKFSYSI
ncbi:MAG: thymidine phosphorylase, partial [Nanoarchaeota archaeon]